MKAKTKEHNIAIRMRRTGLSYHAIAVHLHVSDASVCEWTKHIDLTLEQKTQLHINSDIGRKTGGNTRRVKRITDEKRQLSFAKLMVQTLSQREMYLIASALYWAEGSKQNGRTSHQTSICNSDPGILLIFYSWLKSISYTDDQIVVQLYLHEHFRDVEEDMIQYWKFFFPSSAIFWRKTVFKKNTKNKPFMRYNHRAILYRAGLSSSTYYGLLKLDVRKSSSLSRFLAGTARSIAHDAGWCNGNTPDFESARL